MVAGRCKGGSAVERLFPNDDDGDVLQNMAEGGDRLNQPRDIDFSLLFPDEISAKGFVEQPALQSYQVYSQPSDNGRWDVTVSVNAVPTYEFIAAFQARLADWSAPFHGANDGWGCFRLTD